jgi:hypothetical protein
MKKAGSVPSFDIGDIVCLGKHPKAKKYKILSRSANPVRPDWPWRYAIEQLGPSRNALGQPIRRNCVEEFKLRKAQ